MERTDGSITSSYGDGTREDFLFTYSDAEKWINTTNKAHSDGLLNMEFVKFQRKYIGILTTEENLLLSFFEFYRGGEFYYSNEQLAGLFGWSEKAVQRTMKTLIDKGFVDVSYKKVVGLGTMRKVSFHHTEVILSDESGQFGSSEMSVLSDDIRNKEYKEYIERDVSDSSSTSTSDGMEVPISEADLEQFSDYIEAFRNYREEPDKKGKPKRKKQSTWDTHRRLLTWKKNNDTNFGRNKPEFPLEAVKNASVQYYLLRNHPDKQKPYADFLAKHHVLDKWKEYASMVLGSGFKF